MISVLILTRNEERNLPACIASVAWSDDIHVLDSFSTDATAELAKKLGATVTQRALDNWSSHQNWALQHIPFKHPWVFYLDADERVTPELEIELQKAVKSPQDAVAFRVQRRDFFMGTYLKHVQSSPYYIRLFLRTKIRYERLVHPLSIVDGRVTKVEGCLDHYPFSRGLAEWIDRHNRYSMLEATQVIHDDKRKVPFSIFSALFARDPHQRRFHQKQLFYRLPAKPLLKFLLLFFVKRGFLDGRAGFTYGILQCLYECLVVVKKRELESARLGEAG